MRRPLPALSVAGRTHPGAPGIRPARRGSGGRELGLGQGPTGLDGRRRLRGISDSVLSERLAELTAAGLLIREVDPGPPVGVRYRLAERGVALVPVLRDLMVWARGNLEPTR